MRLEKHHACQHVQYGNQNYLNNRSQPWDKCFRKAHAQLLITHYTKTYVTIRSTWKKESENFDIYMEITCHSKLNRVDERDLSHMIPRLSAVWLRRSNCSLSVILQFAKLPVFQHPRSLIACFPKWAARLRSSLISVKNKGANEIHC